MSRSARFSTLLASVALVALASCGVEASTPEAIAKGSGGGDPLTTTTTAPCIPEEGGGTGGAVGSGDPACVETGPTDPTEPSTTTTTEPELDEQAYIDAIEGSLDRDPSLSLSDDGEEAACAAPIWIETLQVERLADAGLEPSDLRRLDASQEFKDIIDLDEGTELVEALTDCGADLKTTVASAIADAASLTDEQKDCFVENLPDGVIEAGLAISLAEGQTALEEDATFTEAVTNTATVCR